MDFCQILSFFLIYVIVITESAKGPCEKERDRLLDSELLDAHIPECNEDGTFKAKQSYGFTDYCWCAHPQTGDTIGELEDFCEDFDYDCDKAVRELLGSGKNPDSKQEKEPEVCDNPMSIYTSKSYLSDYTPNQGRLEPEYKGWMAAQLQISEYLQITLDKDYFIASISTKGGYYEEKYKEYTKKFFLKYKTTDAEEFSFYKKDEKVVFFTANDDATSVVSQEFTYGDLKASVIRIHPTSVYAWTYLKAGVSVYC